MSENRIDIFSDDSTSCIGRRFLRVPSENHLITTGHQKLYYIRMYRAHLRMELDSNRYLFLVMIALIANVDGSLEKMINN